MDGDKINRRTAHPLAQLSMSTAEQRGGQVATGLTAWVTGVPRSRARQE